MDESPFLDDAFTAGLIEDVEAFLAGDLVPCYVCADFVSAERCSEDLVKFPGDPDYERRHICNLCRIEEQTCELCESQVCDGEVVQISNTLKGPSYDVWLCVGCLAS